MKVGEGYRYGPAGRVHDDDDDDDDEYDGINVLSCFPAYE